MKENIIRLSSLDERLAAAASFVRDGAVLADIGTDHGYLPIALCEAGRISHAYAADVAERPLARAEKHIEEAGYRDRISTVLCDGLTGLSGFPVTDVTICGMGGETIAHILGESPELAHRVQLILQPMTMQPFLRRWLAGNGYETDRECITYANRKFYPVLSCRYTGAIRELTAFEAVIGYRLWENRNTAEHFPAYSLEMYRRLSAVAEGKRKGGEDAREDEEICRTLEEYLERNGRLPQP